MKRIDEMGRVTIPKKLREKYNFDNIELVETNEGILIKAFETEYVLKDYQIELLRKLYFTIKDSFILEDSDLKELKEICRISNVKCPNCKEDMIIDNGSYKCIKCGE